MEFVSTEDMNKFRELGYTFSTKYTPCNVGSTYHVIVTDKDGKEVVHTQCSYGNGSGHGYAVMGATEQAVGELKAIIEGTVVEEEPYNEEFLWKLMDWDYITDYGYTKEGELLIVFGSWEQVEGPKKFDKEQNEWVLTSKSVYAKLVELAKKNLLKPSINRLINEVEYVFDDEWGKCMECGRLMHRTWDNLTWVESEGMELCDDCINASTEALEDLIEQAKEEFSKALPVMIEEEKIEELGYEKLDPDKDFSTRMATWGESSWGCHDTHPDILKELCKKYNGFPKITWTGQFDSEYNLFFPSDKVTLARIELGIIPDSEEYHNVPCEA